MLALVFYFLGNSNMFEQCKTGVSNWINTLDDDEKNLRLEMRVFREIFKRFCTTHKIWVLILIFCAIAMVRGDKTSIEQVLCSCGLKAL